MLVLMVKDKEGRLIGTNGFRMLYPHRNSDIHEGLVEVEKELDKGTYSFIFGRNLDVDKLEESEEGYIYYTLGDAGTFYTKNRNRALYCKMYGEEVFVSGSVCTYDFQDVNSYRMSIFLSLKNTSTNIKDCRVKDEEMYEYFLFVKSKNNEGLYSVFSKNGETYTNVFANEKESISSEGLALVDGLTYTNNNYKASGKLIKKTLSFAEVLKQGLIKEPQCVSRIYEKGNICIWRESKINSGRKANYSLFFAYDDGQDIKKVELYSNVYGASVLHAKLKELLNIYFPKQGVGGFKSVELVNKDLIRVVYNNDIVKYFNNKDSGSLCWIKGPGSLKKLS